MTNEIGKKVLHIKNIEDLDNKVNKDADGSYLLDSDTTYVFGDEEGIIFTSKPYEMSSLHKPRHEYPHWYRGYK